MSDGTVGLNRAPPDVELIFETEGPNRTELYSPIGLHRGWSDSSLGVRPNSVSFSL